MDSSSKPQPVFKVSKGGNAPGIASFTREGRRIQSIQMSDGSQYIFDYVEKGDGVVQASVTYVRAGRIRTSDPEPGPSDEGEIAVTGENSGSAPASKENDGVKSYTLALDNLYDRPDSVGRQIYAFWRLLQDAKPGWYGGSSGPVTVLVFKFIDRGSPKISEGKYSPFDKTGSRDAAWDRAGFAPSNLSGGAPQSYTVSWNFAEANEESAEVRERIALIAAITGVDFDELAGLLGDLKGSQEDATQAELLELRPFYEELAALIEEHFGHSAPEPEFLPSEVSQEEMDWRVQLEEYVKRVEDKDPTIDLRTVDAFAAEYAALYKARFLPVKDHYDHVRAEAAAEFVKALRKAIEKKQKAEIAELRVGGDKTEIVIQLASQ